MTSMVNQTSIVANDIIICYGFYDAGLGVAGLPEQDQCYVTVTPNYSSWMGNVAPAGSAEAGKRFSKLVLPAAHDIGMNSMQSADAVLSSDALVNVLSTINPVFAKIADKMSHAAVMAMAPTIISGLAITQKDTLESILDIGARYFEFRPAFLHNSIRGHSIPDVLYFSHSAIPGMPYQVFLQETVKFLVAHPTEIVVVQLRWDGVPADCARPSEDELGNYLRTALEASNGSIIAGSVDDMRNLTIAELRDQRKRLILFANCDSFSTYTDEGNATLNGDSILAEFEGLTPQSCEGKPFTNLQCQVSPFSIIMLRQFLMLYRPLRQMCPRLLRTRCCLRMPAIAASSRQSRSATRRFFLG